jgi:alkylation response protein AidB-like acyl-CoA dehydrogenase
MDSNLTKDHTIIRETVSKIAQNELVSRAAEIDNTHSFVWAGLKKLREADVLALAVPSEYEGMGIYLMFWR